MNKIVEMHILYIKESFSWLLIFVHGEILISTTNKTNYLRAIFRRN